MKRLLACIAAALLAAPATASVPRGDPPSMAPTGSRLTRPIAPLSNAERDAVRVMHAFAECTVRTKEQHSRDLLAAEPGSPAEAEAAGHMVDRETICVRVRQMRFNMTLLRGVLAEVLYRRDHPAFTPRPAAAIATPSASDHPIAHFARCAVAQDAARIDALIRTRPGSRAEIDALNAIVHSYPACLPRENVEVHAITLRAILAEALYRWASGASASAAAHRMAGMRKVRSA